MTTPNEYDKAIESMPDMLGTPDTNAFRRSQHNLTIWYDVNYKTILRALKLAQRSEKLLTTKEGED